jgi:hypothetical protein
VVAEPLRPFGECRVLRENHAAFAGRDVLDGVKAQDRHVGERAHLAPAVLGAERVAGVVDRNQAVLFRDSGERVPVARVAGVVDADDGLRLRGDGAFDRRGIDDQRRGIDVGEDGPRAAIESCVRGGGEGQRGYDDFVARSNLRGVHRGVEGRRSARHRDGVLGTHELGDRRLELADGRPRREPVGAKDVAHGADVVVVDELAPVRNGHTDVSLTILRRSSMVRRSGFVLLT